MEEPKFKVGNTVWFIVDGWGLRPCPHIEKRRVNRLPSIDINDMWVYMFDNGSFWGENSLYGSAKDVLAAYKDKTSAYIKEYTEDADKEIERLEMLIRCEEKQNE